MRIPAYFFQSLESIYYFRMRVPVELQPFLNRTELKKSLRTKNKSVALRRCRRYVAAAEQIFENLRLRHFQSELTGTDTTYSGILPSQPSANSCSIQPVGSVPTDGAMEPEPAIQQRIMLSELIRLYITEMTNQRGENVAQGTEKHFLRFLSIVTDKPIDRYTVEDKLKYRDILQLMPRRICKARYRGLSVEEIAKIEHRPDELLSVTTVNMRLIDVATMFNWAVNNGLIDSHPFKNAKLKIQKCDDAERPAVSDADIQKIIEHLPRNPAEPSTYWVPLIACFTGMRQSEIAQLDSEDIVEVNGIWCLDINDRGDKRLKNKNAKRIVPLHPVLRKAGLVEFATSRTGLKLFADVKPYLGKYGHQVSKDFAKYRASIGVEGDGQTFHGIRHSVITKFWAAGIPEAHTAAVVGHQRGERESYTRYAKKTDIRPLLTAIEIIDYGEIKLTAW